MFVFPKINKINSLNVVLSSMQYQGVEVESLSCLELELMHCHKVTVKLKLLERFCTEKAEHINKMMASMRQTCK